MKYLVDHCDQCGGPCRLEGDDRVICADCGRDIHVVSYAPAPSPKVLEYLKREIKLKNHGHLLPKGVDIFD